MNANNVYWSELKAEKQGFWGIDWFVRFGWIVVGNPVDDMVQACSFTVYDVSFRKKESIRCELLVFVSYQEPNQ